MPAHHCAALVQSTTCMTVHKGCADHFLLVVKVSEAGTRKSTIYPSLPEVVLAFFFFFWIEVKFVT